ncbi:MAG TPA: hypothetical protein VGC04_00445 [Cellulomonas sp.]
MRLVVGEDAGASSRGPRTSSLLAIGAGCLVVLWARRLVGAPPGSLPGPDQTLVPLVGFFAGVLLHVVPHEVGHAVAALVLRLPVLGIAVGPLRIGRPGQLAGSSGHVRVDATRVQHALPTRMAVFILAGPAANLAIAAVTASVADNPSSRLDLRLAMAGLTAAGLLVGIANLVPGTSSQGVANDGTRALRWITQPSRERAQIALGRDLSNLQRAASPSADRRLAAQPADLDWLRAAAADPRPMIAGRAVTALVSERIRRASGALAGVGAADVNLSLVQPLWEDTSLVIRYASRLDQPAATRAAVAANVALLLSLSYMAQRPGESTDPASVEVTTIARMAELGFAARRDWLPARTALALARLMQDRPSEARDLLRNHVVAVSDADPLERARAMAVWGFAEFELGDRDRAKRLAAAAYRLAPEGALTLSLVHRVSAAADQDDDPVATQPSEASPGSAD